MVMTGIQAGDIVEADVRGRRFYATVTEKAKGELQVLPITPNINYFHLKANQVIGHWKKAGRSRTSHDTQAPANGGSGLSSNPFIRKAQLKDQAGI